AAPGPGAAVPLRATSAPLHVAPRELTPQAVESRADARVPVGAPVLHVRKLPGFDASRIGRAALSFAAPDPPGIDWDADAPPAVLAMHPDELSPSVHGGVGQQGRLSP